MAAFCGLTACDDLPPPRAMSLPDARAALMHMAGQGSTQAFCSPEGQRNFRSAVRNFSAATLTEKAPIDLMNSGDEAWALVAMGVMAKVVQPGDLQGQSRALAMLLSFPGATMPGLTETRDAMAKACPELIGVYRAGANLARTEARLRRAHEDHDNRRNIYELEEDLQTQSERVQSALRRLELKMRNEGWTPETLDPRRRPS